MNLTSFPTHIISFLVLASAVKSPWSILLATIAVLTLLFLILKPLAYGVIDLFRYYQNEETKERLINKLINALIAIILTFIIFFPPIAFGGIDPWAVVVLEFSILLLFFIFILKSARSGVIEYRRNILNLLFFIFISYVILQIFFNTTKIPYQTFLMLKTVSLYFAFFIVITNNVRKKREIEDIIFKVALVGLFISLVGIIQLGTGADKIYWIRMIYAPTFFGTFTYWNHFACYVSMAALLTLGSLCAAVLKNRENPSHPQTFSDIMDNITSDRKIFFMLFSFCIMVLALFLSKSRAGILCFLAAFIFFISSFLSRKYSKKIILAILLGLVVIYCLSLSFLSIVLEADIGIGEVLKELYTIFSYSDYTFRASLYTIDGPKIFKDYPLFGIGLGSLYDILPTYLSTVHVHGWGLTPGVYEVAVVPRYMFNDILQLLVEMGLVGFIVLLIPFSIFVVTFIKAVGKTSDDFKYLVGMGVLSSLLFLGLHTLVDYDMKLSAISSLFVLSLSISLLVINLGSRRADSEIEMGVKRIITLKTSRTKILFYLLSTIAFLYLALIVSRPLITNILTKNGTTFSSFNKALMLDSKNDSLYYKYHEFILDQYQKGYIGRDGAYSKAKVAVDKAIKLNPYKTAYLVAKSDLELFHKDYEEASAVYKEAVLTEPNNPIIQMGYAAVIFWQAIHEKYIKERRDMLFKKGKIYHSKARILSNNQVSLGSVIKNKKILSFLGERLKEEGIDLR